METVLDINGTEYKVKFKNWNLTMVSLFSKLNQNGDYDDNVLDVCVSELNGLPLLGEDGERLQDIPFLDEGMLSLQVLSFLTGVAQT